MSYVCNPININYRYQFNADPRKGGELFCNQRYGNWPFKISGAKQDPWKNPDWFLLSYGKKTSCSSALSENPSENVTDEDAVGSAKRIGALVTGRDYYLRVDSFNESGITEGEVTKL